MKLKDLKIGDKITHYCTGKLVEGTVIELKKCHEGKPMVITQHEPVQWGRDEYKTSSICESSYLQKKWGGTNEHGLPSKGPDTTPGAWYNGKPLTV